MQELIEKIRSTVKTKKEFTIGLEAATHTEYTFQALRQDLPGYTPEDLNKALRAMEKDQNVLIEPRQDITVLRFRIPYLLNN